MRIAVTGGTGFVGTHLINRLRDNDHEIVVLARGVTSPPNRATSVSSCTVVQSSVSDEHRLREAFTDCDVVVHLAGINYERGEQTYENVHVRGTEHVERAASTAGVSKVILTSYLRARPTCGSAYHESKWAAEETLRQSNVSYTILKPGIVYGPGDQMLQSIVRTLMTVPMFPRIGFKPRFLRPLAVADLIDVMEATIVDNRLVNQTVPVVGPEEITLTKLVQRVGQVIDVNPRFIPTPVKILLLSAYGQERVMETPLITTAGIRMLAEGASEAEPTRVCDPLPEDLEPRRMVSVNRIKAGIPDKKRIRISDFRFLW